LVEVAATSSKTVVYAELGGNVCKDREVGFEFITPEKVPWAKQE
jgi:hypothetical protein